MQEFEWMEDEYSKWDENMIKWIMAFNDTLWYLDPKEYRDFENQEEFENPDLHKTKLDVRSFVEEWQLLDRIRKWETTKEDEKEYDYFIDDYDDKGNPDWNEEMIIDAQKDLISEIFDTNETPFITDFYDQYEKSAQYMWKKDLSKQIQTFKDLNSKYWKYWEQGQMTDPKTKQKRSMEEFLNNLQENETSQDIDYQELAERENETAQIPTAFEEDLQEANLRELELFDNETPQITEEESPTSKPKNIITKEKWNYKEMSPDAIKSTFKKGTEMTVKIWDNITSYQIEADEWDNVVVLMLHKRTPTRRIRVSKDTLVNNIVSKAESAVYDNTMKHDIIKSDLPISDLVEQEKINKQRQEDFEKLWLKSWDYIKYTNGDVYKITDIKDGKVYYEDAKTWSNERTYIENIPWDFNYGIANKWTESDFNEAREKVQAKEKQAKEEEEARIQKEKERLEPIQSYLDTIKNASQKTKAQNHLLSSHTWKDLNWKQQFWNRAKMLRSLIDEWYTLNTEETWKFYPNWSPKIEYQLVEPWDKPFRKYFSISKVDYDYVAHQLEQKWIKYDDEEISKEDEEKLEKELFNKPPLTEEEIIDKNKKNVKDSMSRDEIKEVITDTYRDMLNWPYRDRTWWPNTLDLINELFSDVLASTRSIARALYQNFPELKSELKKIQEEHDNSIRGKEEQKNQDKQETENDKIRTQYPEDKWMVTEDMPEWRAKEIVKSGTVFEWNYNWNHDYYVVDRVEDGKMYVTRYDENKVALSSTPMWMEFWRWWELLSSANYTYDNTWDFTPNKTTTEVTWEKNAVTAKKVENEKPKNLVTSKSKVDQILEKANGTELKVKIGNDEDSYLVVFNADGKDQAYTVTEEQLKELNDKGANFENVDERAERQAKIDKEVEQNIKAFERTEEKPKDLVTNPKKAETTTSKWEIQEIDKDTYFDDIVKNLKDHPREMFIYKDWNYYYPHYILPSWKVITPENTYWGEVSSEEAARNWLLKEAEEHSEENENKKAEKLKNMIDKTADKYESTLKRIESDNPMQEIWTSWDYFKYGMSNNQMARAKKESEANAEVWTFKKDVIDWKEWYRIFVAWTKNEAIRAFYDPKTWKTYRIYRWPIIDDSKPYTTKQVERIEKFLENVDKQLDKETKKEKVEKKDTITQEWLDSLTPDKDGVIELPSNAKERYALKQGKETLIKEWKADWKYLYNYATPSSPQYWVIYIKDWNVYNSMDWLDWNAMKTKQDAIDWLNEKEKDVKHEATERYNETDYETLPKTISVEEESEKAWPKRIAPNRVKWQQETYEKWLENVKDIIKQKRVVFSDLWFKSLRGKAVKNIRDEITRIRQLPESEAEKQYTELAKSIYEDLVIKDISKWYRYPEDVTSKFPKTLMKKAIDARARYEKGLFTSFSAKDTRANNQYRDEIWAWIKSQDWKPVTQEQMNEIVDGIRAYSNIFWVNMKKFAEDNNVIYVHLHGGNPFLMWGMSIAWLYRRDAWWNISVSLWGREWVMEKWEDWKMKKSDIKTTTVHEITHAVDGMLEWKLFSDADVEILKKTMNKPSELINYYNRKQEIVARAVEQYAAHQLGKKLYRRALANIDRESWNVEFVDKEANYVDREAYWNQENFDKYVKPIVEKNMNEKMKDYKIEQPKNNITATDKNRVTNAAKAYRPEIRIDVDKREKENTSETINGKKEVKPQVEQDNIKWKMYHVTPADFESFRESEEYNDEDKRYWNDSFWTYVTDSKPFLDDFMENKPGINEDRKEYELDIDIKKAALHPYRTRMEFWTDKSDKLILDWLELVDRFDNPEIQKQLVTHKMMDYDNENFDYDSYDFKDHYTKQEILDMPWNISSNLLDLQFIGEDEAAIDFLFGDDASADRETLKKKWYDAVMIYEWEKDWPVYSYALFYPNKYKKTKNSATSNDKNKVTNW